MATTDAQILDKFLQAIIDDITRRYDDAGMRVTGKTIRSLRKEVRDTSATLYAAKYFRRIEDGRGPTRNRTQGDKPLFELLKEWMQDRGIKGTPYTRKDGSRQDQVKADESLTFLIWRKITNDGDKLYRSGGRSGIISGAITKQRIDAFVGAFGSHKRIEIANALMNR
jgi:hypothetical protein